LKKIPIEPSRDEDDGILTKEFMIKMHQILYMYKKYGTKMLAQANFSERISYLKEIEDLED